MMTDTAIVTWLIRTAVGGGALLLLAWWWQRRLRSPWRQQRLGEWSVAAALVVAGAGLLPAWLVIPVAAREAPAPLIPPVPHDAVPPTPDHDMEHALVGNPPGPGVEVGVHDPAVFGEEAPAPAPAPAPQRPPVHFADVVLAVYASVAVVVLGRWLLANLAVWWLLRRREPVPPALAELFAEMRWPQRCRLVVTRRVEVPFSVGLFRPTVVLPLKLVEQATTEELRWVLAHELSHLERQDTRTCWLFVLGQVIYFYLPWFWWLRRRVRLSQEYLADAAAIEWAGSPADYAQFLVSWAGRPIAAGTGVSGSGSDLFRRVTMLLESTNPGETRRSRKWAFGLASGLIAAGLVLGGLGLRAVAADDEKKAEKPEQKKAEKPEKKEKRRQGLRELPPLQDMDKLFEGLPGLDDESMKDLRKHLEEARKQIERLRKEMQQNQGLALPPGMPGFVPGQGGFGGGAFAFPGGQFKGFAVRPHTMRLGAQVSSPSPTLADQLDLPKSQGVVLEEVGANSAAAKAGLKSHDVLLELNGKTVPSKLDEFAKMVAEIKANTPVDAVVLRKGKKETVKGLTLPEAKPATAFGGFGGFPGRQGQGGAFGFGGAGGGFGGPGGFGGGLGGQGGKGAVTSISRNNDEFTASHKEGDLAITIKGTFDQGKAKVSEVVIDEGKGQKQTYDSLDKVPAEHKAKVKKLAEMAGKGTIKAPTAPDNSF
jgi:beta-lactamase regulating signal transducer with metallopeptidase domain